MIRTNLAHLASLWSFSDYSSHFGYLGILLFFITVDQFTPIPEEITLLTIGYLSSQGVFNPVVAGLVSLLAFLAVDITYYFVAGSGGRLTRRLFKSREHRLIAKYQAALKRRFAPTLIVLCFIPRMRLFGPVLAGGMKLSFRRFLMFDALGLSAFTGLYILLGMLFHSGLSVLLKDLRLIQHLVFSAVMLTAGLLVLIHFTRDHHHEKN